MSFLKLFLLISFLTIPVYAGSDFKINTGKDECKLRLKGWESKAFTGISELCDQLYIVNGKNKKIVLSDDFGININLFSSTTAFLEKVEDLENEAPIIRIVKGKSKIIIENSSTLQLRLPSANLVLKKCVILIMVKDGKSMIKLKSGESIIISSASVIDELHSGHTAFIGTNGELKIAKNK